MSDLLPSSDHRIPDDTLLEHTTLHDLFLVRSSEPDILEAVESARQAQQPLRLQLNGYEHNKAVVAACLWYALDQGVPVIVTSTQIQIQRETNNLPLI